MRDRRINNLPIFLARVAEVGVGLSHLTEFFFVNVGGCYQDDNVSSPQRLDSRVGAAIVVGAWESQAQGEGPQEANIFLLER